MHTPSKRMLRKAYRAESTSGSISRSFISVSTDSSRPIPMIARSFSSHSQSVAFSAIFSG